jgi:broad specificity phosphatase PhoE
MVAMQVNRYCFFLLLPLLSLLTAHSIHLKSLSTSIRRIISSCILATTLCTASPSLSHADMLLFPLPAPLKNNFLLMRAGESFADARHEIQTNPVKKLRQDNSLTPEGREQAIKAAKDIMASGFLPTFIRVSTTERSYETAVIVAKEIGLGQNRIVPEYSFLDARAAGIYEGLEDSIWDTVHSNDEKQGVLWRPPPNTDGTPTESVSDVLVRGNQLVSTVESMYSGENVVIISPDSDNLSILTAALISEDPDESLPHHSKYSFKNGEWRFLYPVVKRSSLLVTGQTRDEADVSNRKYRALRLSGAARMVSKVEPSWRDLWHLSVDNAVK